MKALIVIEIPDDHLGVTLNDLFDRLKGYKCDLKPMPKMVEVPDDAYVADYLDFDLGWNACLEEITGEEE